MVSQHQHASFAKNNLALISVIIWFVVLLLQALITPLHIDEAYYRLYGQDLAWGYFDHPPGIAITTALSDVLLPWKNLAVRFVPILLHVLSLIIGWRTLKRINPDIKGFQLPLFLVILILPMFHVYSFIATPDVVLFFSAILFYSAFVLVKQRGRLLDWLWWGITMALLMYSKYHGILIIGFVILSDFRLLRNPNFYLSVVISLSVYFPHLYWQHTHDWASVNFHLFERENHAKWHSPIIYLAKVILILNPFVLWHVRKLLLSKPDSQWDKNMLYIFWGIIAFFFLQSFRSNVQAQWLYLCYIPFIYFISKSYSSSPSKAMSLQTWMFIPSLMIIGFIHVCLSFNILPTNLGIFEQDEYAKQIEEDAKGLPVVFYNSYKRASIYSWYTGEYAHSYNTAFARKNQFNIWSRDSIMLDKEVYFVGMHFESEPAIKYGEADYGVKKTYHVSDKIKVYIDQVDYGNDSIRAKVRIENPYPKTLRYPSSYHLAIYYFTDVSDKYERQDFDYGSFEIEARSSLEKELIWVKPKNFESKYTFGIATSHNSWPDGPIINRHQINSK